MGNTAQNRIALITGGAQGIGLACAQALLDAGNRVAVTDIQPLDLAHFPEEQRSRVMSAVLDVSDTPGHAVFCARMQKDWGNIGILVNNAGMSDKKNGQTARVMDVGLDEWRRVLDVNLNSMFRLCQVVAPRMQEAGWGRIVNISSLAGRTISRVAGVTYSVSKAGIVALTRNLANELGPLGITVNTVAPGRVVTPLALRGSEEINKEYAAAIPVRRLGTVEEVAAAVAFLASEITGFINGATIDINGGYFMP